MTPDTAGVIDGIGDGRFRGDEASLSNSFCLRWDFMVLSVYFSLLSLFYAKEFGSIIVKDISETFLIQSRDLDSLHLD
jgi:hypothetical protein